MAKLTYNLDIYTFDIDLAGHVNNGVYIRWMEIGRTKLFAAIGIPVEQVHKRGFYPVLVHTEISYKRPLFMGDQVEVQLWVSELTKVRAVLRFHFLNREGVLVAHARQIGAFIDLPKGTPRRLSAEERGLFADYLEEEENR